MAKEVKEEIKEEVTTEETGAEQEVVEEAPVDVVEEEQTEEPENEEPETTDPVEEPEEEEEPEFTVTIKLADGTVFEGLKVNGDNLISEEDIKDKLTPINLVGVEIDGFKHEAMRLAGYRQHEDGYHFVLLDKPKAVLDMEKLNAKIEYVAIMADVEVE